jgi:hypothetical protein
MNLLAMLMNYVVNEITFTVGATNPIRKYGQINEKAALRSSDIYVK